MAELLREFSVLRPLGNAHTETASCLCKTEKPSWGRPASIVVDVMPGACLPSQKGRPSLPPGAQIPQSVSPFHRW